MIDWLILEYVIILAEIINMIKEIIDRNITSRKFISKGIFDIIYISGSTDMK